MESELSYAYLHAVASHAACTCTVGSRHEDNAGVDAKITAWGPFPSASYIDEVDLKVQLKATVQEPAEQGGFLSYSLSGIAQYNDLRSTRVFVPRVLVVLFLPKTHAEWVKHTEGCLSLYRCAYWVSLRGAPESSNTTSQTVYLPKAQRFDSASLLELMDRISCDDIPVYEGKGA